MIATREQVEAKLREIKRVIEFNPDNYAFNDEWEKNKKTLIKLGIKPSDVEREILDLEVENYSEGPKCNKSVTRHDLNEEVWVLGKEVQGILVKIEVYIKISVISQKSGTIFIYFLSRKRQTNKLSL